MTIFNLKLICYVLSMCRLLKYTWEIQVQCQQAAKEAWNLNAVKKNLKKSDKTIIKLQKLTVLFRKKPACVHYKDLNQMPMKHKNVILKKENNFSSYVQLEPPPSQHSGFQGCIIQTKIVVPNGLKPTF